MQHLTSTERIEALNTIVTLAWQMGGGLTECHHNVGAIEAWVDKIIASLLHDSARRAELVAEWRERQEAAEARIQSRGPQIIDTDWMDTGTMATLRVCANQLETVGADTREAGGPSKQAEVSREG